MRRLLLLVVALGCVGSAGAAEPPGESLEDLVDRLGHPVYAQRRDAQRRLQSRGLSAFDTLRAGRDNADPEIAGACRALLAGMTSNWVWGGESDRAREVLSSYRSSAAIAERYESIRLLDALPYQEGIESLVRIVRFDPFDLTAREAARVLIEVDSRRPDTRRPPVLAEVFDRLNSEHGRGQRPAARWVRLAVAEWRGEASAAEAGAAWRRHAKEAAGDLRSGRGDATPEVVATLLLRGLRSSLREDNADAVAELVRSMIDLTPDAGELVVLEALRSATDAKAWSSADQIAADHQDRLAGKRGRYAIAELAEGAGRLEEAQSLAEAAHDAPVTLRKNAKAQLQFGPRVLVAEELLRRGRDAWAETEFRAAFADAEPLDGPAAVARWRFAEACFERGRYADAAETLSGLVEAVDKNEAAYQELPRVRQLAAPAPQVLRTRYYFVSALAARDRGDLDAEIAALEKAIQSDPGDADILIAMHRVDDPPVAFAKETRERIEQLKTQLESDIWGSLEEPNSKKRAVAFNHWAWLVGNTFGDYDKAVRYSQRSLDILPETAGFLDTLGRCHFAAGDLDEAIRVQRRAIELDPFTKPLRRQLVEFEAAHSAETPENPE